MQKMTEAEWLAKGNELFGEDMLEWKFVCPICGHVQTPNDFRPFKDAGATPDSARNECIGRYTLPRGVAQGEGGQPCDYAGYGLIQVSPIRIAREGGRESQAFAFAGTEGSDGT
jgi:hypothetical protein